MASWKILYDFAENKITAGVGCMHVLLHNARMWRITVFFKRGYFVIFTVTTITIIINNAGEIITSLTKKKLKKVIRYTHDVNFENGKWKG